MGKKYDPKAVLRNNPHVMSADDEATVGAEAARIAAYVLEYASTSPRQTLSVGARVPAILQPRVSKILLEEGFSDVGFVEVNGANSTHLVTLLGNPYAQANYEAALMGYIDRILEMVETARLVGDTISVPMVPPSDYFTDVEAFLTRQGWKAVNFHLESGEVGTTELKVNPADFCSKGQK